MKRAEDLKTVSKTNKMLKELFMGKPPASFKDDFFLLLSYIYIIKAVVLP